MQLDANVRVSFDTKGEANNEVRKALTGTVNNKDEEFPFKRSGTGFYQCSAEDAAEVGQSLVDLGKVLKKHAAHIDHVFISVARASDSK